jgi:hypothetical protein
MTVRQFCKKKGLNNASLIKYDRATILLEKDLISTASRLVVASVERYNARYPSF